MGSDLAKRPSESAPANRDSSESEKSNDSSRIKGVWKSGSNCHTQDKYEEPHANMIMIRGEKNSVTQRELLSSKEKKQGLDIGLPKHRYPSSKPA